jgi:membrane protein
VTWKREILNKLRFFLNALKKFDNDNGLLLSSGITFNLLVGLIPLTLLLLALSGSYLFSDREVLDHLRHYLERMVPALDPGITENIFRLIQDRKVVGILGIGGLVLAVLSVFSSLRAALNIVFEVEKPQGIIRGTGIDLFMLLLAGIFHIVSMAMTSVFTFYKSYQFQSVLILGSMIIFFLKYLVPFFFTFWMFFFIYKIAPNRKIHSITAFKATCFTSVLWEVAKQFFGWYVHNLGKFSVVYGSLSTLVIFVLWVSYSAAILILGGEVAFLLEKERKQKPSTHR